MENKKLLLELIKKLEKGEINFYFIDEKVNANKKRECILKASSVKAVKIGELKEVGNDKTLFAEEYDRDWNKLENYEK